MEKKPTDQETVAGLKASTQNRNLEVPGDLVVGFVKGISKTEAEEILKKYNLTYEANPNPNAGKVFFYETGEKYIVKVPIGEEEKWIEILKKEPKVKMVMTHFDPNSGVMID